MLVLNADTGVNLVQDNTITSAKIVDGSITDGDLAVQPYKMVLGTAVASTSGTSIDFTGIPSWAKRITVMFDGVSTSGTSNPIIRIGSGGMVATTGYTSAGQQQSADSLYTNGFGIPYAAAANVYRASFVLTRMSGNTWVMNGHIVTTNAATQGRVIGSITLAGELDIISATTVNGTDTFDLGSINIMYEG